MERDPDDQETPAADTSGTDDTATAGGDAEVDTGKDVEETTD